MLMRKLDCCRNTGDVGTRWIARMVAAGKLSADGAFCALDIAHGVAAQGLSGACVSAVDPGRLVVDGGRHGVGRLPGTSLVADEVGRLVRWKADVAARPGSQAVVKGTKKTLSVCDVVIRVVTGDVGPRSLDVELGVYDGRVGRLVCRELALYAEMFLAVEKAA